MEQNQNTKIVFSAIKPTGKLTLGNYIGAIKNMVKLQEDYRCFYSVADLHSITVPIEPAALRENTLEMFAYLIACGIDPQKSVLFVQSHVATHSQLTWVLNCYCQMGEARRMVAFKEKSAQFKDNVNVGLFDYPVLQAADILLYNTDVVPIGQDQKQHLELARNIAERFNSRFSPTFKIPEGMYPKHGAKVYSLLDPAAKMGKTDDNPQGTVFLFDDKDTIIKKFKRAVTDSGSEIIMSADKKGISNLITIYSAITGKTTRQTENEFKGFGYGDFKLAVGEAVADKLAEIQVAAKTLLQDKKALSEIMKDGAQKAAYESRKTLSKVYRKVGFLITE